MMFKILLLLLSHTVDYGVKCHWIPWHSTPPQQSLIYTKHPLCRRNCPIKIFLLEDVSHYRPPGSLWSSLQPVIWTTVSGSHCHQIELIHRSESSRSSSLPHVAYGSQNRKLTFGQSLLATTVSSTLESGDRASDLYHGNNDLYLCQELRGLLQGARHLWLNVTVFGGETLHSALW